MTFMLPPPVVVREKLEYELYFVIIPYILRSGAVWLFWAAVKRVCKGDVRRLVLDPEAPGEQSERLEITPNQELGEAPAAPTVNRRNLAYTRVTVNRRNLPYTRTWNESRIKSGLARRTAVLVSIARLLFWHWMQPVLYATVFYAYSDIVDEWQYVFGFAVLVREGMYFVVTLAGLVLAPGFLLFSPSTSEWHTVLTYIAMPEKFVVVAIGLRVERAMVSDRCGGCFFVLLGAQLLFDMCAIAALVFGGVQHTLYIPLVIGYSVTAVSAAAGILGYLYAICTPIIS